MKQQSGNREWPVNLTLTTGVIVTLVAALLMSQLDALQLRSVPALVELPVANPQNPQDAAASNGAVIRLESPPAVANPLPTPASAGEAPVAAQQIDANRNAVPIVCGQVPAGWVLYTVRAGDTLDTLAISTQTGAENLRQANCLQPFEEVSPGMQILIPQQIVVVACGPPQWWVRYQVQSGDTVWQLANRYGVSAGEILAANCLASPDLTLGKFIYLPPLGAGPLPTARPSDTPAPTLTAQPTAIPTATGTSPAQPGPSPTIPGQPTLPPTATRVPTTRPTVWPTATPPDVPTATGAPQPSSTPQPPQPTSTVEPSPTTEPPPDTPPPPPSDTPVPPTHTPLPTDTPLPTPTNTPLPTETPEPPTDTPMPPTDTPDPPTDTPESPTAEPTATAQPAGTLTPGLEAARLPKSIAFRIMHLAVAFGRG